MTSQRPWTVRMQAFAAYMRECGHRFTWMHTGQKAHPIGFIKRRGHRLACNDNRIGA